MYGPAAHQADEIGPIDSKNKFREVVHRAGDRVGLPADILISVEKMGFVPAALSRFLNAYRADRLGPYIFFD